MKKMVRFRVPRHRGEPMKKIAKLCIPVAIIAILISLGFSIPADATVPKKAAPAGPEFIVHDFGVILFPVRETQGRPTCALQAPDFVYKSVETAGDWNDEMKDAWHRNDREAFAEIMLRDAHAPGGPEAPVAERPDGKAPDAPDIEIPDAPDLEAPDAPDIEKPEAPDMEAPDAPDIEIPDAPDMEAPDAHETEGPRPDSGDSEKPAAEETPAEETAIAPETADTHPDSGDSEKPAAEETPAGTGIEETLEEKEERIRLEKKIEASPDRAAELNAKDKKLFEDGVSKNESSLRWEFRNKVKAIANDGELTLEEKDAAIGLEFAGERARRDKLLEVALKVEASSERAAEFNAKDKKLLEDGASKNESRLRRDFKKRVKAIANDDELTIEEKDAAIELEFAGEASRRDSLYNVVLAEYRQIVNTAVSRARRWNVSDAKWKPVSEEEAAEREAFAGGVEELEARKDMTIVEKAEAIDEAFLAEGLRRGLLTPKEYEELKDMSLGERSVANDKKRQNSGEAYERFHHQRWALGLYDPFLAFYPANREDWPARGAKVNVEITFAGGKPFYWYPRAEAANGLSWKDVSLTTKPRGANARTKLRQAGEIEAGGKYAGHWYETARGGDSLYASAGKTYDKFLFYGGVMRMTPAVAIERKDGIFYLSSLSRYTVRDIVLISKKRGEIYYARVPSIAPGVTDARVEAVKIALSEKEFADEEASRWGLRLKKAGLYEHEVHAVVAMMRHDLFEADGTRALYLATDKQLSGMCEIKITPEPERKVTAFICAVVLD